MKKITTLLIIIICFGILVISCPDERSHKEAVIQMASNAFRSEVDDKNNSEYNVAYNFIGNTIVGGVISLFVNFNFTIDNYFIFSVGKMDINGQRKTVSFGILGHVFTPDINNNEKNYDSVDSLKDKR